MGLHSLDWTPSESGDNSMTEYLNSSSVGKADQSRHKAVTGKAEIVTPFSEKGGLGFCGFQPFLFFLVLSWS